MKRDSIDDGQKKSKTTHHKLLEWVQHDFEEKQLASNHKKSKIQPFQGQLTQLSKFHAEMTQLMKEHHLQDFNYRKSTLDLFKTIANDPKTAVLTYFRLGQVDSYRWPSNIQSTIRTIYKNTIRIAKLALKSKLYNQDAHALRQFQQQHQLPENYFHDTEDRELGIDTITPRPPELPPTLNFPSTPPASSLLPPQPPILPPPMSFFTSTLDRPVAVAPTQGASRNWLDEIDWTTLL